MMSLSLCLLGMILVGAPEAAAALIQFDYMARVDEVDDPDGLLAGIVTDGDILVGSFSYESDAEGIHLSRDTILYIQRSPFMLVLDLAETTLDADLYSVAVRRVIIPSFGPDIFAAGGVTRRGVAPLGADEVAWSIQLIDETLSVFPVSLFAPTQLDLSEFTDSSFVAEGRSSSEQVWGLRGRIVELIPEPSSLGLLAFAALGVAFLRIRQRRTL